MHLHFCFEGVPTEQTPAAMLKYYRQRKCLTTRQLAESVGIAPATVLMYERERFPIPYQTAVAMAEILEIDRNMLVTLTKPSTKNSWMKIYMRHSVMLRMTKKRIKRCMFRVSTVRSKKHTNI